MLVTRNHVQEKGVRDQRPHAGWEGCQPERMFDGRVSLAYLASPILHKGAK